jgi:PAS domain S-box-containing protein
VTVLRSGTIARIFHGRLARQLAAVAAVVLATLLRMALERRGLTLPTYITFYPAVILAALLGGMWAGTLATALSALSVDYFFLAPIGQLTIGSTSDVVAMAIFCISGVSISLVMELYHRRGKKLAALQIEAAVLEERRKLEEAQARAESIRAERQRFLDVLETLPPMISLMTQDRHIAFANRSFRERFGECRGQRCFEARFGRAEPCDFCETYSVFETGQPHHWEVIFPDGSLVDAHDFPFTDLDGSSLILEMGVDITERRRSETELKEHREHLEAIVEERTRQLQAANAQLEADMREREQAERVLETTLQRFYAILSNLSAGVLLVTNEGRIEFANQALCDLFKLAESPADLVAAFDSEKVMAKVHTAYENPEQAVLRVRELLEQGQPVLSEEVPMQDGGTYLRDFVPLIVDGKSYGRMWVHTDITELKRKEGALRESRAKLAAALANMSDSVIITDAEGRFVEFNDAFARFYRFKSKAECARNFDEFANIFEVFLANGERAPREMYAIQRALRGEAATGAEYTLRRKDTGESWIGSISFSPIRDIDGAIIGSVITARDITEAKRAETRLRRFYETDLFAILYWTIDGGVLDVNDKFLAMTGYSREDVRAGLVNWSEITPPEYWALDEDARRQIRETGIHLPYEKEFVRKDGARVWGLFSAAAYEDDRSQGVSFILDITKRKRAEEALREERATLHGILDATDESVWLIGADCTILSANATALKRVGRQAEEIIGKTIHEITDPKLAESRSACIRQVVEKAQPLEVEDERAGMLFRHSYYPVVDSNGRIDRVVAYSRDITQSKRAEETLHRYRLLAAHTRDIVLFIRFDDGLILEANAAAAEAYGYTIEQLKCMKIHDLREPNTRPLTDIEMSKAEMQGILFESIHQRADGSAFPVEVSSQGAKIGGIRTLISIIRDITERKRAEEYSKNSFVTLSNFVPQFVWMCTPDGLNTYFNQRWVDYTGLTLEESYGRGWNTPFHPDDQQAAWDAWNKAVEAGGEYSIESRLRAADGSYRWFLVRGEPMRDASGNVLRWFGTCTDIEDMKRESEGRFRSVVGSMSEGLMFFDPKGNAIYQNPASLRIHAFEAKAGEPLEAELRKATWKGWDEQGRPLSPNEWPMSRVFREAHFENQVLHVQRIETGHEFDASYNGCLLHDSAGNVTGGFITIHDITKRKRAEEALRSSQKQLQAIIDGAPFTVVFLKDLDGRFVTVNSRFEELLGITRDDVRGKTDYDIMTRERADYYRAHDQLVLETGQPMQIEEVALLADGKEHTFLASKFPLVDAGGKPYAVCAISVDITERKRMEKALQESEERYRNLFSAMTEGFCIIEVLFDARGKPEDYRFLEVNEAFERQTGLHDAVGKRMRELAPAHEAYWFEKYGNVALTGEPAHFMNEARALNRWYDVHAYRVGEPKHRRVAVVFNDFSDYKKAQEALLQSERLAFQRQQLQALAERLQQAREEERKMVARDLHDDIGQILTAIKMDMTWAVRHLPRANDEVHDRLKGSIELINDGVRSVRKICSGLRPGILDDLGLAAAVEWQSNEFAARAGILCEVSVPAGELRLDGDRATAIFRIYQECLTNIARHAEARTVRTSLYQQDESLVLVVRDDGKGFRESEVAGSLGVLGMKERAQVCGGSVQVSSSPGEGTTVTVCVPLHDSGAEQGELAHTDSR